MRKSNKQRRISQDQVVSASLESELVSLLFDTRHVGGNKGVIKPNISNCSANDIDIHRLHTVIKSHHCLAIEKDFILKQIHGMLVLRLSEQIRTNSNFSTKHSTLTCLEVLYEASGIVNILDNDEKSVVSHVLQKILCETAENGEDSSLAQLCLSIIHKIHTCPDEWQRLQLHEFRAILIALVKLSSVMEVSGTFQILRNTTDGIQKEMVAKVIESMATARKDNWCWSEDDYLTLLDLETRFHMGSSIPSGEEGIVDKLIHIACSAEDMSEYAARCLVLYGEKQPKNYRIFKALLQVFIEGGKTSKKIVIPGLSENVNGILDNSAFRTNSRSIICTILQILRENSNEEGKVLSLQSAEFLNHMFVGARPTTIDVPLRDIISICAALLENPHVDVSSCMCDTMLQCLDSVRSMYGPLQLEATELLSSFVVNRAVDSASVSQKIIHFYSTILGKHSPSLMDLPRIPSFLESVVKIAHYNWERQPLRDSCLEMLVKIASSPFNQSRLAHTAGVIPLLVKRIREQSADEFEYTDSRNSFLESVKSCIQTLAAAI